MENLIEDDPEVNTEKTKYVYVAVSSRERRAKS
jgi:hypothetical protein